MIFKFFVTTRGGMVNPNWGFNIGLDSISAASNLNETDPRVLRDTWITRVKYPALQMNGHGCRFNIRGKGLINHNQSWFMMDDGWWMMGYIGVKCKIHLWAPRAEKTRDYPYLVGAVVKPFWQLEEFDNLLGIWSSSNIQQLSGIPAMHWKLKSGWWF